MKRKFRMRLAFADRPYLGPIESVNHVHPCGGIAVGRPLAVAIKSEMLGACHLPGESRFRFVDAPYLRDMGTDRRHASGIGRKRGWK